MQKIIKIFILLFIFAVAQVWAQAPQNFQQAKKIAKMIWEEQRESFYCSCRYDKLGQIDLKSCDYRPSDPRKSKKITWEHVVPASWYGRGRDCWQGQTCATTEGGTYGGRNCCRKRDDQFRQMEADLFNLVPAIAEINTARSDYVYGEFYHVDKNSFKYRSFGCDLIIDEYYKVVEPRDEVKGMIARIHFYMARRYGLLLSPQQQRLMEDWQKRFPPNEWEKSWVQKVVQWQPEGLVYWDPQAASQLPEQG